MLEAEPKFASMTWVYFLGINCVITVVMFTMFTAVVTSWFSETQNSMAKHADGAHDHGQNLDPVFERARSDTWVETAAKVAPETTSLAAQAEIRRLKAMAGAASASMMDAAVAPRDQERAQNTARGQQAGAQETRQTFTAPGALTESGWPDDAGRRVRQEEGGKKGEALSVTMSAAKVT